MRALRPVQSLVAAQVVVGLLVIAGLIPWLSPPGCIDFELSTSIEVGKVRVLDDLAEQYNGERHFVDGRCVEVSVHGTTSGLAMQALRDGWDPDEVGAPEPQAWTPTSSMWFDRLELDGRSEVLEDDDDLESITQSVLVVAMPETMAEAIGYPDQQITWAQIRDLSEQGWGSVGHPDWGAFTFGKDDPDISTSGLGATVATFLAAAQVEGRPGLQPEDVDDQAIRGFVQDIEAGVHNYEPDILDTLRNLARYDADGNALDYVSAMVLQEQLVTEYNAGAYSPPGGPDEPNERLVALYPTESTLRLDHPFVVLSSASTAQRHAADDFRRYLREPDQQAALAEVGFRTQQAAGSPLLLDREIADSIGGEVQLEDVSLVDPPSPETVGAILDEWRGLRRPANVLLVVDTSVSLAWGLGGEDDHSEPQRLTVVQDALHEVVGQLVDAHDVGLWTFPSGDPQVPWSEHVAVQPLPRVREELDDAIDGMTPAGATPLYRTVAAAYAALADHADDPAATEDRINAVIVLSDGINHDPTAADYGLDQLRDEIEDVDAVRPNEPPVQVFVIGFSQEASFSELEQIAQMARGEAFDATDPERLDEILPEVLDAL